MDHEGITINFIVPATEPPAHRNYRLNGGRAPTAGKAGTIYHQGRAGANPKGPSGPELAKATYDWLRAHKPYVLESRLEKEFNKRGWKIIWTPQYCPKFQPIELVWGIGKQRVAWAYYGTRTMKQVQEELRIGWYGGTLGLGHQKRTYLKADIAGCWRTALKEINKWLSKDSEHNPNGLTGTIDADGSGLVGVAHWTETGESELDIQEEDFTGGFDAGSGREGEVHEDDDAAHHAQTVEAMAPAAAMDHE